MSKTKKKKIRTSRVKTWKIRWNLGKMKLSSRFIEENKKKKGKLGSTSQSERIDKFFTPARCQTKPYQSKRMEMSLQKWLQTP